MGDTSPLFNLTSERWIPVLRKSGRQEMIAPWQITDAFDDDPPIALAAPRPDFNGALHEFLIGLLTTCFAPEDERQWREFWHTSPSPETLKQVFSSYSHAFNLDGDGPRFMQDFDELAKNPKPVSALLIDAPGEKALTENADHFGKRGGVSAMSPAMAAMALFTLQTYAPAGGAGHRTSLRGGGPLTTLVTAQDTLWGRLWPNVESQSQIKDRGVTNFPENEVNFFPWLRATRTSEKNTGRAVTPTDAHPLQVYWGMPRRIRLIFSPANGDLCSLTGEATALMIRDFVTQNYGVEYSQGWEHPLSPYYRQKAGADKLPVHPQSGGVSYRHWLGHVFVSTDGLRQPSASVIRAMRRLRSEQTRLRAFGYDMDNMKARDWVISEMPLMKFSNDDVCELIEGDIVKRIVPSAALISGDVTGAIKRALFKNPKEAKGDLSHIADRFWRNTETEFFSALDEARRLAELDPEGDDPTFPVRENWLVTLRRAALSLFDEFAPASGIEFADMHRLVAARFSIVSTFRGRGSTGKKLYQDLGIPTPDVKRKRDEQLEGAGQ